MAKSQEQVEIIGDPYLIGLMHILFLMIQLFWVMNNITNNC